MDFELGGMTYVKSTFEFYIFMNASWKVEILAKNAFFLIMLETLPPHLARDDPKWPEMARKWPENGGGGVSKMMRNIFFERDSAWK